MRRRERHAAPLQGVPPISHKNIPDAAASGISLSKKSFQTFSPNCFQNCKINFCSTILQFCRCGGLWNAKGNPDGFLSHFSSLRNFRLSNFPIRRIFAKMGTTGFTGNPHKKLFRQHRKIQQEHSARDFSSRQGLKSADVLCVPQTFRTDGSAKNIRRRPKLQWCGVAPYITAPRCGRARRRRSGRGTAGAGGSGGS